MVEKSCVFYSGNSCINLKLNLLQCRFQSRVYEPGGNMVLYKGPISRARFVVFEGRKS